MQHEIWSFQERLAGTLAGDYRLSGDDMMHDALKWMQEHPASWTAIESYVRGIVRDGKKASLQRVIYRVAEDEGFKAPDKNLTAAFQRHLMGRVPGYLDSFAISKSRADDAL